jgi:hypothetical protein
MPLDESDASDLSIEDSLCLRRQNLSHSRNKSLFERRKTSPHQAETLRNSHT